MRVPAHSVDRFATLNRESMVDWLRAGMEAYLRNQQSAAFAPFDLHIHKHDTLAGDLAAIYESLPPPTQAKFRRALSDIVSTVGGEPERYAMWLALIELTWRIEAREAVPALARRLNQHFIDHLTERDGAKAAPLFGYLRNLAGVDAASVSLLRQIVQFTAFRSAETGLMLVRLCEIAPDDWASHFALLRAKLHEQMTAIRIRGGQDKMNKRHDELAADILELIGIDRLEHDFHLLFFGANGDWPIATDNWFMRALFGHNRTHLLEHVGNTGFAYRKNPTDVREFRGAAKAKVRDLSTEHATVAAASAPPALQVVPKNTRSKLDGLLGAGFLRSDSGDFTR